MASPNGASSALNGADKNVFRIGSLLSRLSGQVSASTTPPRQQLGGSSPGAHVSRGLANSEFETHAEQIESLQEENRLMREENRLIDQDRRELESKSQDLQDAVESLSSQLEATESSLQAREADLASLASQRQRETSDEVESLRVENEVMGTRLEQFEAQMTTARDSMAEEMDSMHHGQGALNEELYECREEKREALREVERARRGEDLAQEERESLRRQLAAAVEEKEERLLAANTCVHDVKEVVDELAQKLRDNEVDLERERGEVARLKVQLEESRCNGMARRRGSDTQLEELNQILTQVQAAHEGERVQSRRVTGERDRALEEVAGLRAEGDCLQDELAAATTRKVSEQRERGREGERERGREGEGERDREREPHAPPANPNDR